MVFIYKFRKEDFLILIPWRIFEKSAKNLNKFTWMEKHRFWWGEGGGVKLQRFREPKEGVFLWVDIVELYHCNFLCIHLLNLQKSFHKIIFHHHPMDVTSPTRTKRCPLRSRWNYFEISSFRTTFFDGKSIENDFSTSGTR